MKSGAKIGSGFRTLFWGLVVLAHFPHIFGPAFWEAEYRHDLHFGARFWNREIWRRIKQVVPDAVTNLYVASSHIGSTAAKNSRVVPARCMYTLVLAPCSNCGGPLCKGTLSKGFFGLVNEPAKPSKTVGRFQQELHVAPTVTAEIMYAQ